MIAIYHGHQFLLESQPIQLGLIELLMNSELQQQRQQRHLRQLRKHQQLLVQGEN